MMVHPGRENFVAQMIKQSVDGVRITDDISEQGFLPINICGKAVGCRDLKQRWNTGQFLGHAQNTVNGPGYPAAKIWGLEFPPVSFINEECIRICSGRKPVGIHHLLTERFTGKGIKRPGCIELMNAQKPAYREVRPDISIWIGIVVGP